MFLERKKTRLLRLCRLHRSSLFLKSPQNHLFCGLISSGHGPDALWGTIRPRRIPEGASKTACWIKVKCDHSPCCWGSVCVFLVLLLLSSIDSEKALKWHISASNKWLDRFILQPAHKLLWYQDGPHKSIFLALQHPPTSYWRPTGDAKLDLITVPYNTRLCSSRSRKQMQ